MRGALVTAQLTVWDRMWGVNWNERDPAYG
jgi:hypothetical protein